MKYETIIGLEVHVQLKTKSKMFCACANEFDISQPNQNICPVCTGHPGILPVVNEQAIKYGVMAAVALNLNINKWSKFDRKSYFYPDLPKGYQISQYDKPLASNGYVEILLPRGNKKFGIERLHLEEDAAKNFHQARQALIDFNRCGAPLVEIVTQPDFRSPAEARIFLQELRLIMRSIDVSDADMEKGQLRCDANISLRLLGDNRLYPKTEIKNLNSFRAVEKALSYEVLRQAKLWDKGKVPEKQSTRGWDESKGITVVQRGKEEASDYRYFPEPDLPPLEINPAMIEEIKNNLPELPNAKRLRMINHYGFKLSEVNILINTPGLDLYAEKVVSEFVAWLEAADDVEGTAIEIWERHKGKVVKLTANWLLNNLLQLMHSENKKVEDLQITPEDFAEFLSLIFTRKVNSSAAQAILNEMFKTGQDPSVIIEEKDLGQVRGGEELGTWVDEVIKTNPEQVEAFKDGKEAIIKFLIGMVMKKSGGKADPQEVESLLRQKLK